MQRRRTTLWRISLGMGCLPKLAEAFVGAHPGLQIGAHSVAVCWDGPG